MEIDEKKLDDLLAFERLRAELTLLLREMLELSKLKLEKAERLKIICTRLHTLKSKHKIKLEEDLRKAVFKYGQR